MPAPHPLFQRVRAWNVSSWRHADRIPVTRAALDLLSQNASAHDGQNRPPVPDAGVHALADQLQVLTADALDAGVPVDEVREVLDGLASRFGLAATRRTGFAEPPTLS